MKKVMLAAIMFCSAQVAMAEVQVGGPIAFVGAGNMASFSIAPASSPSELLISIDTASTSFNDWNDVGSEFATTCAVYPIGNAIVVDTSTPEGKQAFMLAASANATRQNVIVTYHVVTDANWQQGKKCVADIIFVAGEQPSTA